MALCLAFGCLSLQRAAAQAAPPVAFQVPAPVGIPSANGAIGPSPTKIVRIFGGTGHFDDALAERLRPMLAKAFPSAMPDPIKAVPAASISAPTKPEGQAKVAAAHQ